MQLATLFPIALMVTATVASPLASLPPTFLSPRAAGGQAASQLLSIAPTANTCVGSMFADECETAATAAPFLINAFMSYKVYSPPELAAIISLIAFETGDFKYAENHYPAPGRPGQGTRNLQMANFNLEYALSISALSDKAKAIAPSGTTDGLSDDQLNQILALVLPDEYSWASAAWFYTTKCASIRSTVQAGGQAGLSAYLGCVGTTPTADRLAYWTRANAAFGLS